jgi:hypothetical protein
MSTVFEKKKQSFMIFLAGSRVCRYTSTGQTFLSFCPMWVSCWSCFLKADSVKASKMLKKDRSRRNMVDV